METGSLLASKLGPLSMKSTLTRAGSAASSATKRDVALADGG